MNERLQALTEAGVSVWLDDLGRHRLDDGSLQVLIDDCGVTGVTTNPTIFAKALGDSEAYSDQIDQLASSGADRDSAVRAITSDDVRRACDLFRPAYDASAGADGFVSLEVDPRLAGDTAATVTQAAELWGLVDRPNLLVKIPGTHEGLDAITETLAAGINVNVTLIFGLDRYEEVMHAWLAGLERAHAQGRDLAAIASVASFFVSRVDTAVDRLLDQRGDAAAHALRGKAAVANACVAFSRFERMLSTARWQSLAELGARPQRPLWASTGVKDKAYPDTRYVVDLVTAGTVNTMPEATLLAVADHAPLIDTPHPTMPDTVRARYAEAQAVLDELGRLGISYDEVVLQLEREGVAAFEKSWAELLDAVQGALDAARSR